MGTGRRSSAAGRTVVLGVGEPFRRDDGCGPLVVRALRGRVRPGVERVEQVTEMTELIDLWDGAALAVVVDAMSSGGPVGSSVRWEGEQLLRAVPTRTTSSHGLSVRDAFELGRALGRLPERLVVYLIEVGEVGPGEALSPAVAAAVARTAEAIAADVGPAAPRDVREG